MTVELVRSARDADELASPRVRLDRLRDLPIPRREWDRAVDMMQTLAERGPMHHRQIRLPAS
jgi:predicted nucleic acid-binding protein